MEPRSPSKFKIPIMGFVQYKRVFNIGIIVLAVVLLLVGVYHVFGPGRGGNVLGRPYFTVVVDCGSTGTRVNVYEWVMKGERNWELPMLMHSYPDLSTKSPLWKGACQYHCLQTEPGLDKFVGNYSGVRASLEPLILWAEQQVPPERRGETPVFVLATAGLRRLDVVDVKQVLDDAEAVVGKHAFLHRRSWIRVLSGKEEAYYGWIALNYEMGRLGNNSRLPTLGLLDLGGSSLQVVMEVGESREDGHLVRSRVGLFEHRILAYSLTEFGINKAFDRTVSMLSQVQPLREGSGRKLELQHPCLGSDYVNNYTCDGCIFSNATDSNSSQPMRNHHFTSVYLVGDLNWEQCKGLAKTAAIHSSSSDWSNLTLALNCKAHLPSHSGSNILNSKATTHAAACFHALSGFFVVYTMLNLSQRANMTEIWERGQQLCSRSDAHFGSISGNYARQFCFSVPYLASLIEDGLCLGDAEINFGPGDVSWTLGAALVEGEYLWLSTTNSRLSISSLKIKSVSASPFFLFILLLGLLLIVYCSQIKLPMPGKRGAGVRSSLPSYIYPKRRPN